MENCNFDSSLNRETSDKTCFSLDYAEISTDIIKEKYGFDISFTGADGMDIDYDIHYFSDEEKQKVLLQFSKILLKYPDFLIRNAHIRKVYLFKDIKDKKGNQVGGFQLNGKIFINCSGTNIYKFSHELFHRLDNNDGNTNKEWGILFGNTGVKPIKNFSDDMNDSIIGYANKYGMLEGVDEDQATIAEYLLSPHKRRNLFYRAISDSVLREKIMVITGSYFDSSKGVFTRNLSREEYKEKFGFDNFSYYSKWSLKDGKVFMDFNFWNNF